MHLNTSNLNTFSALNFNSTLLPSNDQELLALNQSLSNLNPDQRLQLILSRFHDRTLVLSSAGIGSRLIPELIHELSEQTDLISARQIKSLPFVLIDTGALFPETVSYAGMLARELDLNFHRVAHNLDSDSFLKLASELVQTGRSAEEAFDEITKVWVLRNLLKSPELLNRESLDLIISGNRRDDSPSRSNLKFIEYKNDKFFFYPIADLSDNDVEDFYRSRALEDHPLKAKGYLSVGNIHDSQKAEAGDSYVKAGRHSGDRQECGLHLRWTLQDLKIQVIRDWKLKVTSPSPQQIEIPLAVQG